MALAKICGYRPIKILPLLFLALALPEFGNQPDAVLRSIQLSDRQCSAIASAVLDYGCILGCVDLGNGRRKVGNGLPQRRHRPFHPDHFR